MFLSEAQAPARFGFCPSASLQLWRRAVSWVRQYTARPEHMSRDECPTGRYICVIGRRTARKVMHAGVHESRCPADVRDSSSQFPYQLKHVVVAVVFTPHLRVPHLTSNVNSARRGEERTMVQRTATTLRATPQAIALCRPSARPMCGVTAIPAAKAPSTRPKPMDRWRGGSRSATTARDTVMGEMTPFTMSSG
jgi:hypothetical protein